MADSFGRKIVILVSDLFFSAGSILLAFATSYAQLLIGRALVGFGIGFSAMIIPLYLSEMSPEHIRGKLVTINVVGITIG